MSECCESDARGEFCDCTGTGATCWSCFQGRHADCTADQHGRDIPVCAREVNDIAFSNRFVERGITVSDSPHEVIVQVLGNTFGTGDEYARDILDALGSAGYAVVSVESMSMYERDGAATGNETDRRALQCPECSWRDGHRHGCKVRIRERIVEEFVEAVHDTHTRYHRGDAVAAATVFLDRNPNIIEGWPTE